MTTENEDTSRLALRALHQAVCRMDAVIQHLGDQPGERLYLEEILRDAGKQAHDVALDAISDLEQLVSADTGIPDDEPTRGGVEAYHAYCNNVQLTQHDQPTSTLANIPQRQAGPLDPQMLIKRTADIREPELVSSNQSKIVPTVVHTDD